MSVINRTTPIEQCRQRQTSIWWPVPVDQRLDELRELVVKGGFDVSRSQLLAALVTRAPARAPQLENLVREYKKKKAGNIVLQPKGPIREQERKPGRRKSRGVTE